MADQRAQLITARDLLGEKFQKYLKGKRERRRASKADIMRWNSFQMVMILLDEILKD